MQRAVISKAAEALFATAFALSWCAFPAAAVASPRSTPVQVWLTDLGSASRLTRQPDVSFTADKSVTSSTIGVDESRSYQAMIGFGASFTDSSALVAYSLDASQRSALMRDLFDPKDGIGLGMLRQPMGASDFSATGNYSYDDMPAGQTDPPLSHFSVAHDLAYIVPLLKQAREINPSVKIVATPWSPPGWMKTSDSMVGGSLKPDAFGPLAQYFARFVQAYEAQGVHVDYVTPQNEPLYEPGGYPGMLMEPEDQRTLIRDFLGPALSATGLGTAILAYDHNWDVPSYPETIYNDPSAAAFTPGTAWHCYAGDPSAQTSTHDAYPNEDAHLTECSGGEWQGTQQQAFDATMALLVNSPRNWARDVVLWNMALDQANGPTNGGCLTCRGVVTIAQANGGTTITKNVDYYALGHLSKFVRPGAVRIGSTALADASVENVAFRNPDGSTVLVAHNTTGTARTFRVLWGTSAFSYTLGAGAAVTFTWAGSQPGNTPGYDALAQSVDIPFTNADGSRVLLTWDSAQAGYQHAILSGARQFAYTLPVGASLSAGGAETLIPRTGWTASASSTSPYGDVPRNAIDGNLDTRWSSGHGMASGDWFQVDMGATQNISGLLIDSAGSDFARGYQVYVSNDGVHWGSAIASGPGSGLLLRVVFPTVTTRFIRVVQTGSAGNWWTIAEFRAFITDAVPVIDASVEERAFTAPNGAKGLAVYNPQKTSAKINVDLWSDQSLVYTIPPRGAAVFTWIGAHGGIRPAVPTLTALDPTSALPGEGVVLTGSGFGPSQGASAVRFGELIVPVVSWSNTAITVAVPDAAPAGPTSVSVTVYGQASTALPFTVLTSATALPRAGWTASASSSPFGDVPANAIDGNIDTRWSTGHPMTKGDWFQVDMGSPQTFSQVAMDSGGSAGDYARGYQVFVSADGANWGSPIASGTGRGRLVVARFATQIVRYVRVVETQESGSWWSIAEFYAFP